MDELERIRQMVRAALAGAREVVDSRGGPSQYELCPDGFALLEAAAKGDYRCGSCPTCGVVVANERLHRAWHGNLPARIVAEVDAAGARRLRQS